MSKRKPKDYSRAILERIVGTKSKATLAEAFKLAFAEKYDVKREEMRKGIVDKVYNKVVEESFTLAQMKKAKEFDFKKIKNFKQGDLVTWDGAAAVLDLLDYPASVTNKPGGYVQLTRVLKNGTVGKMKQSWTYGDWGPWKSTNNTRGGWER